jgi:protein-S-isoprenylcysteine O-methyltransferase Ste14
MVLLHSFVPVRQMWEGRWRLVGMVPGVAGLLLAVPSIVLFFRHKTALRPGDTSRHLVVEGPFRYTRNPMYLGMVLLLVGLALSLGSVSPWGVIPVFNWMIGRNIIPVEEAMMTQTFGPKYEQYRQQVRRWI